MYTQVSTYLECCSLIIDMMFGFRKEKSTTDAVGVPVKFLLKVFECKGFTQATFCDLSKSFDWAEHASLLNKLYHYDIGSSCNNRLCLNIFLESVNKLCAKVKKYQM